MFFGDTDPSAAAARAMSANAELITNRNCLQILQKQELPDVCYSSYTDLGLDLGLVYSLLDAADEIIYCPSKTWSENKKINYFDPTKSVQGITESILLLFQKNKKNVKNLSLTDWVCPSILELADKRCGHENPQIWITGCSISHGVGVRPQQRYGQLVATTLGLPVSFLTAPGSSVEWATDQLLRSDIRRGDIVIWGLTSESRMPWLDEKTKSVWHINASNAVDIYGDLGVSLLPILCSQNSIYKSVTSVYQVIKYCRDIQAHLLIIGILQSDAVTMQLIHLNEFAPNPYPTNFRQFLDFGVDNMHPGPKQHEFYSQFIIQQLKQRSYI